MLTVDCPPEEADELAPALQAIRLGTGVFSGTNNPTGTRTGLGKHARGYVYYVSLKGHRRRNARPTSGSSAC